MTSGRTRAIDMRDGLRIGKSCFKWLTTNPYASVRSFYNEPDVVLSVASKDCYQYPMVNSPLPRKELKLQRRFGTCYTRSKKDTNSPLFFRPSLATGRTVHECPVPYWKN
jgi:hypothetical protein